MARITIELPEELSEQLAQVGERLPELLALSLQQPALPAHIYSYILNFLASNPTCEQIVAFEPTLQRAERLSTLISRERSGVITETEREEIEEYERIEHLVIMLKAGSLPYITSKSKLPE